MRGAVQTVQWGGEWTNQIEGEGREGHFWTKQEAQQAGRVQAKRRKLPHLVYNQYGALEEGNSYWNYPPGERGSRQSPDGVRE